MSLRAAILGLIVALAPAPALAQLFANPFADAAAYQQMRGTAPSDATYRLRYEVTRTEPNQSPVVTEVVIDVAPDWSLTREGEQAVLRDFRLSRYFTLQGETFTSMNGLAELVFRVMERQNRAFLQRISSAAGVRISDACDAEVELGVSIPGEDAAQDVRISERRGAVQLRCGGRAMSSFTPSEYAPPPAAFWPTIFSVMTTHPALHRRMRDGGRAPSELDVSYQQAPDAEQRRHWRLIAVETVTTPYPLSAAMHNVTADVLDHEFAPGLGEIATEAVGGRAQGGAPTAQSWAAHLTELERRDGNAAAAMLLLPTYNMFPELEGTCDAPDAHPVCALNRGLRNFGDPAPMALLEIGMAEQQRNPAAAIAAMQRAQASPLRDHPALGASFALALLRFDDSALAQARAANLPTDATALQLAALRALPYNPAYWTDVGDRFGGAYDWFTAFIFYDVAFSLPMPSAIARNRALVSKRDVMDRVRRDFPDAGFPATP